MNIINNINNINNMNNMNNNMMNNNFMYNNMMMNNNFMNNNMMNPMVMNFNNISNQNKLEIKTLYREILQIDDNYFVITSSKHIKGHNNNFKHYCYLSLFNYNLMQEINKIEIDIFKINTSENFKFDIKHNKNNLIININIGERRNEYLFELKNGELLSH